MNEKDKQLRIQKQMTIGGFVMLSFAFTSLVFSHSNKIYLIFVVIFIICAFMCFLDIHNMKKKGSFKEKEKNTIITTIIKNSKK